MKSQKSKVKTKKFYCKSGFTLIEILIASYIFLLVVVAGTMIFSSTIGAKMKASAFWETQQEARYAMEKIVKLIREENVKGFTVEDIKKDRLILCKDVDCSEPTYIIALSYPADYIYIENYSEATFSRLTSENVKVTKLQFEPSYFPDPNSIQQPYITIEIEVENAPGERVIEKDTLKLRTTVSLRTYKYKYYDY